MRLISGQERDRLLAGCQREALHLEMRDIYAVSTEADRFARFLATGTRDHEAEAPERQHWTQLVDHLIRAGKRVWDSLGIIPSMAERRIWQSTGFWIFDQGTVRLETPSAELTITQRSGVAVFEKRFAWLQASAWYGDDARALVQRVRADVSGGSLDGPDPSTVDS